MATITNRASLTPARTADPCCCPACTGLECLDRTRFFAGQLLSEADLNNDQSYWLAKNRLHNRYLHGWGVVCGLQVVCGDCDGWVTIKTGYAIDPCGNDIVVCAEQPFNVAKAIQACCTPVKTTNCSPPRSAPPPNCQDVDQQWCITIQYDEEPTRAVAPLRPSTSQTCGCGGSSKGGCSCGGSKSSGSTKTACCCSTSVKQPSTTPGCEPTRILETFKLGVCAVPTDQKPTTTTESTCVQSIRQLMLQQPSLSNTTSPAAAYTQVCNYLASIRKFLASSSMTHCQTETALASLQIPKPGEGAAYISQLQAVVQEMTRLLTLLLIDCVCLSLLPTCPPDPCTNCLVLACVTVRNGQIIDICHFGGGRRQLVTFNSLGYWLSLLGLDKSLTTLTN